MSDTSSDQNSHPPDPIPITNNTMEIDDKPTKRLSSSLPPPITDEAMDKITTVAAEEILSDSQVPSIPIASINSYQPDELNYTLHRVFTPRTRRFSAGSFSPVSNCSSPGSSSSSNGAGGSKVVPRISQLKQEECADLGAREMSLEREVMSDSRSCEDLSHRMAISSNSTSASPSPSHQQLLGFMTPSPSSSSRSFTTRRSMSPVTMRPSRLAFKRKLDHEIGDGIDSPPNKRISVDGMQPSSLLFESFEPVSGSQFLCRLAGTATPSSITSSPATETSTEDIDEMDGICQVEN